MSFTWVEYFEAFKNRYPSPLAFALEWWNYNAPLLQWIRRVAPPPARIIEVGTGTGALAVMLAAHGYDVLGVDIDPQVVEWARKFAEPFGVPCRFELGNGFDLTNYEGRFELAYSAGLLEHFVAGDAVQLLHQQSRAAALVLAIVPTWFALRNDPYTRDSGAHPMGLRQLKRLFADAGLKVFQEFTYGAPDGNLSRAFRYLLPPLVQRVIQNRLSYACTIGCFGRAQPRRMRLGGAL